MGAALTLCFPKKEKRVSRRPYIVPVTATAVVDAVANEDANDIDACQEDIYLLLRNAQSETWLDFWKRQGGEKKEA